MTVKLPKFTQGEIITAGVVLVILVGISASILSNRNRNRAVPEEINTSEQQSGVFLISPTQPSKESDIAKPAPESEPALEPRALGLQTPSPVYTPPPVNSTPYYTPTPTPPPVNSTPYYTPTPTPTPVPTPQPSPTTPSRPSTGLERAYVVKDIDFGDAVIIERPNGEQWLLEPKTFCSWCWRYEGRYVYLKFSYLSSKLITDNGDTADFWTEEQIK